MGATLTVTNCHENAHIIWNTQKESPPGIASSKQIDEHVPVSTLQTQLLDAGTH